VQAPINCELVIELKTPKTASASTCHQRCSPRPMRLSS